jgi:hypothetical protein
MQKDGSSFEVILQDDLYIPKLMVNLISLTKAISTEGVQLSSKGQIITLQIGKNEIFFETIFQHGFLGIELHPIPIHIAATAHLSTSTSYTPCLDILILKFWQLLFTITVSKPRSHWSIPVVTVLSANRIIN